MICPFAIIESLIFLSYSRKNLDFSIFCCIVIIRFFLIGPVQLMNDKAERKLDIDEVIKKLKKS